MNQIVDQPKRKLPKWPKKTLLTYLVLHAKAVLKLLI